MGKEDLTAFASVDQISYIFTDEALSADWAEKLRAAGLKFTVCPMD
jgi:DeoR/GlpR family transcriptional regulator of sugar metabolism